MYNFSMLHVFQMIHFYINNMQVQRLIFQIVKKDNIDILI